MGRKGRKHDERCKYYKGIAQTDKLGILRPSGKAALTRGSKPGEFVHPLWISKSPDGELGGQRRARDKAGGFEGS